MKKIKKIIAVVALCVVAVQAASAVVPADTGAALQARSDIKTKPFGI